MNTNAAQRREQHQTPPAGRITITHEERARIHAAAKRAGSPYRQPETFLAGALGAVAAGMNAENIVALREFALSPDAPAGMVVSGLPTDQRLPRTPTDSAPGYKTTFVSEAVLAGVAQLLGQPYSYSNEKRGALLHNIVPVPGKEHAPSNQGSETQFRFHTEAAYLDFRPDFLALLCLRKSANGGGTLLADTRHAFNALCSAHQEQLRGANYHTRAPVSFEAGVWSERAPMITGDASRPVCRVNFEGVHAATPQASEALAAFSEALSASVVSVTLEPGELLIVNNKTAVHGRDPFTPSYDGKDRWLQRVYIRASVTESQAPATSGLRVF
jgi:L-asparagine oxygenase